MSIVYTLLAAAAVGYLLDRLHVPGGMMVGAVAGACALNLLTGEAHMPAVAKTAAQVVAGAFIGSGVRREDIRQMRSIVKVAAIVIFSLFIINVLSGLAIYALSPLDPLTAMMASTPGGLSDIPIIAAEMGAEATPVLALQLIRFVLGIAVFPSLIGLLPPEKQKTGPGTPPYKPPKGDPPNTLLTLLVATGFGLLGRASGVPGGTMAFATLGSIGFKLLYPKACMVRPVRKAAQCLSGAYVGSGIGMAQLLALKHLALPAVVLVAAYTLGAVIIGALLRRHGVFNRRESLLAATPAGATDMALISADLGVYNVQLILLQVMRLIVVITLFPTVLQAIARLLAP